MLAGLATLTIGLAACSGGPTLGQPTAAPSSSGGGQDTSPANPSSSASSSGGLPVSQPCSLLSAAQLSQLGVSTQPTQDMVGTAPSCEMDNGEDNINLAIRTTGGLGALTSAQLGRPLRDTTVGSHQAKESVSTNDQPCLIAIGVAASSRVDVVVTGNGDTDPCPLAMTVATFVEPNLP
jgi:hypothetical protein